MYILQGIKTNIALLLYFLHDGAAAFFLFPYLYSEEVDGGRVSPMRPLWDDRGLRDRFEIISLFKLPCQSRQLRITKI